MIAVEIDADANTEYMVAEAIEAIVGMLPYNYSITVNGH